MKNRFLLSLLLSISLLIAPASAANPFSSKKTTPTAVVSGQVAFVPSFESVDVYSPLSNVPQNANPRYFATDETAKVVMEKFGATNIELAPAINNIGGLYILNKGPFAGQGAVYRMLVFPIGTLLRDAGGNIAGAVQAEFRINAGILADEYVRNPEALFPEQHFITGYPPVQGKYLSNAEQGVWRLLIQASNAAQAAKAAKDAEEANK